MTNHTVSQSVEELKVRYLVTESTLIFKKGQFVPRHVALDGRTVATEEIVSLADVKSRLSTLVKEMEKNRVLLHIDEKRGDNIGVEEEWGNGFNAGISAAVEVINRLNK